MNMVKQLVCFRRIEESGVGLSLVHLTPSQLLMNHRSHANESNTRGKSRIRQQSLQLARRSPKIPGFFCQLANSGNALSQRIYPTDLPIRQVDGIFFPPDRSRLWSIGADSFGALQSRRSSRTEMNDPDVTGCNCESLSYNIDRNAGVSKPRDRSRIHP